MCCIQLWRLRSPSRDAGYSAQHKNIYLRGFKLQNVKFHGRVLMEQLNQDNSIDTPKIVFMINTCNYYYKVMPLDPNNTKATY